MMKSVLPLLQLAFVALRKQNLFVDARHIRGSQSGKLLVGCQPHCEIPEAVDTENQRLLKKDDKGGGDKKGGQSSGESVSKDEKQGSSSESDKSEKKSSRSSGESLSKNERRGPSSESDKNEKKSSRSSGESVSKDERRGPSSESKKSNKKSSRSSEDSDKEDKPVQRNNASSASASASASRKNKNSPSRSQDSEDRETSAMKRQGGEKINKIPPTPFPTSSPTSSPTIAQKQKSRPSREPPMIAPIAPTLPQEEFSEDIPASEPVVNSDTNPRIEPEVEPEEEPELEPELDSELDPELDPEPELEPELEPVPAPEPEPVISTDSPTAPFTTWLPTSNKVSTPEDDAEISSAVEQEPEPIADPTIMQAPDPVSISSSETTSERTAEPNDEPTEAPTSSVDVEETVDVSEGGDSPVEAPSTPISTGTDITSDKIPASSTSSVTSLPESTNDPILSENSGSDPAGTSKPDSYQSPVIEFDKTKFIAGERLQPITFKMTVSKFTEIMNKEKLNIYFSELIGNVMGMRSNQDWYPSHLKSIDITTLELFPVLGMEGEPTQRSSQQIISVELVVNGLVFVHLNEKHNLQTSVTPRSAFHDIFDHSMLLYFTFWGVDDLQKVLNKDGGLQNPVIESVYVGWKQLIGIDQDGNYFAYENEEGQGSSNLIPSAISSARDESASSTRASMNSLMLFLFILGSSMWWLM